MNPIDALDKEFEERMKKELESQEIVEEPDVDEVDQEEPDESEQELPEDYEEGDTDDDEGELDTKLTGNEEIKAKPEPKNKQEYAFKELRENLKREREEKERLAKTQREVEELAKSLGYKDAAELIAIERQRRLEREAQERGVDPKYYTELVQLREEVNMLKQKEVQERQTQGTRRFQEALDTVVKDYKLTEVDKQEIFNALAEDGYTVDMLINNPQPQRLLRGYVPEQKIAEKTKQLNLDDKSKFKEKKHTNTPKMTNEDKYLRELDAEMAEYAASRGLTYKRKYN